MGVMFNAEEMFQIAIQVEANGAAFYRVAAGQHTGDGAAFLNELAAMEDDHKRSFEEMRAANSDGLSAQSTDLYNEGGMYLSAIASGYRVEGSPKVAESLTGKETLQEILDTDLAAFNAKVEEADTPPVFPSKGLPDRD
jgi:rubrerythrin